MESYIFVALGGVIIGVLVAAPIGPVNLICIRRTLAYGSLNGFFSGLGGAAGDGVFAAVTAFGLTAVAGAIEGNAPVLTLTGGIILIGYGVHNFRAEVTEPGDGGPSDAKASGDATLLAAIAGTFFLTIANPATLIGFAALFAGLGSVTGGDATFAAASVAVAGVIAGSATWWFTITAITGIFHKHVDSAAMRTVNHISGVVIGGFGVVVLADLAFGIF